MIILITDLDGTLARAAWRSSLRDISWDVYHGASFEDEPNSTLIALVNRLSVHWKSLCITGRPERWRQLTNEWLVRHDVTVSELLMRRDDDRRPSPIVKVELACLATAGTPPDQVIALDDRPDVIAAYAAQGFQTLLTQEC